MPSTRSAGRVGSGSLGYIGIQGDGAMDRCAHSIPVVLTHEYQRQFPEGGQIERFMGLTAGKRSFSEETDRNPVSLFILGREC